MYYTQYSATVTGKAVELVLAYRLLGNNVRAVLIKGFADIAMPHSSLCDAWPMLN